MRIFTKLSISCLLALLAATTASVAADIEVPRIQNGEEPLEGRLDLYYDEVWRAGGEDDENFFGVIWQALAGPDEEVYLLDGQLCEVPVYSSAGERLRTLGGRGDGPGEINNLTSLFFLSDGGLGMIQSFPGRVVTLKADGTPGDSFRIDAGEGGANFGVLRGGICFENDLYLAGTRMQVAGALNTQMHFLSRCDLGGREQVRYFESEYVIDYSNHVASEAGDDFGWNRWAIDTAGRLIVAPHRNEYEIHVIDREGRTLRIIERDFSSRQRTDEEKESARLFVEAIARNHPIGPQSTVVEDTEPDIRRIWARPDGGFWVYHSRSTENLDGDAGALLDAFDGEGVFKRQLALHLPWNADQDILQPIGPNRVLILRGAAAGYLTMMAVSADDGADEAAQMEVICVQAR